MPTDAADPEEAGVLRSKRTATRYQILVEIADRQPAVNQQEIADAIGVTAQAVSGYLLTWSRKATSPSTGAAGTRRRRRASTG